MEEEEYIEDEEYNEEEEDQEGAGNNAHMSVAPVNEPEMQACSRTSVTLALEQLKRLPEKVSCQPFIYQVTQNVCSSSLRDDLLLSNFLVFAVACLPSLCP